jgi:hypothetical protein
VSAYTVSCQEEPFIAPIWGFTHGNLLEELLALKGFAFIGELGFRTLLRMFE